MRLVAAVGILALACGPARPPEAAPAPAEAPKPAAAAEPPAQPPPPDPLAAEAVRVVDRQVAAYNRGDTAGFLATYADSVVIETLGDSVAFRGKPQLAESVREWFTRAPGARAEVLERTVLGPFVVVRQRVTEAPGSPPVEAIGIYEVREGLIRRVWTIPPAPTPH